MEKSMSGYIYRIKDLRIVGFIFDDRDFENYIQKTIIPTNGGVVEDFSFINSPRRKGLVRLEESSGQVIIIEIEKPTDNKEVSILLAERERKIEELKQSCSLSTFEGFYSQGYQFGFNEIDQANFTQQLILIVAGDTSPVRWKTKNLGVREFLVHEFSQVVTDAKNHRMKNQERFWELEEKVLRAETIEEINAINWTIPS